MLARRLTPNNTWLLVFAIRTNGLEHGIIEHRLMVEHEAIYCEMIRQAGRNTLGVPRKHSIKLHWQGVVMASDRMVTAHIPVGYEYEHEEKTKIIKLLDDSSIRVLLAGDVLRGHEVLELARSRLLQKEGAIAVSEAAETVRESYQQVRRTMVVHTELEPRGLNLNDYYNMQQGLQPHIVQMIDNAFLNADLGVQLLIAGANGTSHSIYSILSPGTIHDHAAIGHGAIGSGAPHALSSLIEDSYSVSMSKAQVVELVQKAKSRSEVAPGVGTLTTLVAVPTGEDSGAEREEN